MKTLCKWVLAFALIVTVLDAKAQSGSQLEQDLNDLRAWMNRKISQGDSATRAEWPNIKREFNIRTESLDRKANRLTEQSKEEYREIKSRYRQWEEENEERYGEPLSREEAANWERNLAGRNKLKNLKAHQMRDVWVHFMEQVRAQRSGWSLRDWDYAEHVYRELSDHKQEVLENMSNGDKIKVAALQVEFNTLRKSRDAKDLYQNMRENR